MTRSTAQRGKTGSRGCRSASARCSEFLADAHSNAEIAAALCISEKTVESHRGRIFKKLDVHSLVDLVRLAARARPREVANTAKSA